MASIKFKVTLCYLLLFCIQSSYADHIDDCKLINIKEPMRKFDILLDSLRFNEDEDDLKKTIVDINGKISDIIERYHNLPEECQNASVAINEFVRDMKLILQCNEAPPNSVTVSLFEGYISGDSSYFKEILTCAEGMTSLDKQAEVFRALARISIIGDFETNKKFYYKLKNLIATADSTISNILMEAMARLVGKTIKIPGECNIRTELLLDLYEYDKLAGKLAVEIIAVDLCRQFSQDCFTVIEQIPYISLRAYAYLAMVPLDTNSDTNLKEAITIIIIPHLESIMNLKEFKHLDEDLKNEINKAYQDTPEEVKALITEGEICLFYISDELNVASELKTKSIYLKGDDNDTMIDWKFIENTEGVIETKPITSPQVRQLFIPRSIKAPEFWSGNMTNGNWEMAPGGIDCDFTEETHNIFVCRNFGSYVRSPGRTVQYFRGDQVQIKDINTRRKSLCEM